jgi:hypothetical protein
MGATSEAGFQTAYSSSAPEFPPIFICGVHVAHFLVFCVVLRGSLFGCLSFGYCIVCLSSFYG